MSKPNVTPVSRSRNDVLLFATRIVAQITGTSFEEAFQTWHGETEAYQITEKPSWIRVIPDLASPLNDDEVFYKVVEFKWGMRKLSVEIWFTKDSQELSGPVANYARIRISDLYNQPKWKHFGKTEFRHLGQDWILEGGVCLWIPWNYAVSTNHFMLTKGTGSFEEINLQISQSYLKSVKGLLKSRDEKFVVNIRCALLSGARPDTVPQDTWTWLMENSESILKQTTPPDEESRPWGCLISKPYPTVNTLQVSTVSGTIYLHGVTAEMFVDTFE